ncbi:MAG: hypothetical protein ACYCOU_00165 [Sulfobacillus sp.]
MATPQQIAQEWKGFDAQRRQALLAKMTPEEKGNLRAALEGKTKPSVAAAIPFGAKTIGPLSSPMPQAEKPSVSDLYGPGVGGYVEDARQHAEKFLGDNAPPILATVLGTATGGAGFVPALAGAGVGGFLGEKAQGNPNDEALKEGAKQAALEAGGRISGAAVGKVLSPLARKVAPMLEGAAEKYPILKEMLPEVNKSSKKAVDYLTAASGPEGHAPIAATIADIEKGMQSLPTNKRTVGTFLEAVNAAKDSMNKESGEAMFRIANKETIPQPVIERLEKLITPNMQKTAQGREEAAAIKRAITEFQKPWTYGELDAERMTSRARLHSFHAQESVAQYAKQKASRNVAIDNAIEQGLKDTIYSEMDRASGKQAGYFANLKGRQSNLIQLESILNKRVEDLAGKTSVVKGSPRFSTENLSVSMHAGGTPRLGVYSLRNVLSPSDLLKTADKRVAKAFAPPQVSALPYQVLLSSTARAIDIARRAGYTHTAKNAQGHTIGSNDGATWFDQQTGAPVDAQ